ncbi:MAG: 2-oxoacid ferredoxin oxidoreductase, partial [Candidatus Bathyarchaeota archaeon]
FAFLDVFQPCVTFNYLNTHDWFKERIYKLEEEDHDCASRQKALEKSLEWGDRIPIGIFYREDKPTYRDRLPHVRGVSLTKNITKNIDINPLLKKMM